MGKLTEKEIDKTPFLNSGDFKVSIYPLFVQPVDDNGKYEDEVLGYAESVEDAKFRIAEWKKLKKTAESFRTTPYDRYIFHKDEGVLDVDFGSHCWFIQIKRMSRADESQSTEEVK